MTDSYGTLVSEAKNEGVTPLFRFFVFAFSHAHAHAHAEVG
jgi:hypothetical protein